MQKARKLVGGSVAIIALCLMSGCDLFKTPTAGVEEVAVESIPPASGVQTDMGAVLLKIKGKPVITEKSFQEYKDKFAQAQPQYAPLLNDPNIEEQIFLGYKNEALIGEWAKEKNLDNDPKFQKELQELMDYAKRGLYVKSFHDAAPVKISDAEIKQYYDENKNTPQLMASAGGIQTDSVTFDTKDKAEAFLKKAKEKGATKFADAAKEANVTVKKLGQVNKHSFDVEGPLREKVLTIKTFPSVDIVPVKDKFVVFAALEKKEPEYVPFSDVKEGIARFLEQQKAAANLMERLAKLEKEYNVETSDYFEHRRQTQEEQQKSAIEAMKQSQSKEQEVSQGKTPRSTQAQGKL